MPTSGYSESPCASGYRRTAISNESCRIGVNENVGSGYPMKWIAIGY